MLHAELLAYEFIHPGAGVFTAAIIEYLTAEILELAGNAARDNNRKRIIPRHITLAVRTDDEFSTLLKDVTIAQGKIKKSFLLFSITYLHVHPAGGVKPHIHSVLLPLRTAEKKAAVKLPKARETYSIDK